MLQSEDVDDDYFTPISNTPLASIFKDKNSDNIEAQNTSLKYIPPKPEQITSNSDEPKTSTQCVFASAFLAYEWLNNTRSAKGKVGLAIIKNIKMQTHSIILYDANKKPLSCTTVTSTLDVLLDGNYMSFYDDQRKYWSIYGTEAEVEKYLNILRDFNVNIRQNVQKDQENTDTVKSEDKIHIPPIKPQGEDVSYSDSSLNKKTRAAIVNRMASMGQSVLPTNIKPMEKTSDSSDTDDFDRSHITVKPKSTKTNIIRKGNLDRVSSSIAIEKPDSSTVVARVYSKSNNDNYQYQSQLSHLGHQPCVQSLDNAICDNNGLNIFMSEQRISNTELRININRISDKMEDILDKIKVLPNVPNTNTAGFQIEIYQKLINEYENKIRNYEDKMKNFKSFDNSRVNTTTEVNLLNETISGLTRLNTEKDVKIAKLEEDLKTISEKVFASKTAEHISGVEKANTPDENHGLCNQIKNIMNIAYQNISNEFRDDENYSGKVVKDKVGSVIRMVTIDSLEKLEL